MTARVIIANPVDVAVADQAAAALGCDVSVQLNGPVSPGTAYVVDHVALQGELLDEVSRRLRDIDAEPI